MMPPPPPEPGAIPSASATEQAGAEFHSTVDESRGARGDAGASEPRIVGYDMARALAILGMVLVHFALILSFDRMDEGALGAVIEFLDGRAAATFMVLAGVGLTLRSRRAVAVGDPVQLAAVRGTLIRRGLVLLVIGFLNLLVWPGDILRVYGVSLLVAAWFLTASTPGLWSMALAFAGGFLVLMGLFDYEQNWEWETLEYQNLWTSSGMLRHLFYDGFRSVFPWTGMMFLGMWLGRLELRDARRSTRVFAVASTLFLATEAVSRLLFATTTPESTGLDREALDAILGTKSMPPLPLFLSSSTSGAVAVIAACVWLGERFAGRWWTESLAATGQMALTWYLAHLLLLLATVIAAEGTLNLPPGWAILAGVGFFSIAVSVSVAWRRRFARGPLEELLRRFAG